MQRVESYGLRGLLGEPRRGADISRRTATMHRPNPLFNDEYEQRGRAGHFEYRADGDVLILTGYASVFNAPYEVYGGPPMGWTETIDRHAFDQTLSEKPDLHLLINHEGLPLARTKSGTVQLSADNHGLKFGRNSTAPTPTCSASSPRCSAAT